MKSLIALLVLVSFSAFAVNPGDKAPDFTLGKTKLSDLKGKTVVLEWLNFGCPFVKKHYGSGNMQSLQKKYIGKDVVWLSIVSSAEGKQGHMTEKEAEEAKKEHSSKASKILLDKDGKVGQLYGAVTTPHMFVINKEGTIVYQGAIDDKPDTNPESIPGSVNYVSEALDLTLSGKKVTAAKTKPYGCSVKY